MTNGLPKSNAPRKVVTLSRKAQQTRNRIKSAALATLNELGYRNLHITDVTRRAEVASGLFYRYFRDLRHVTHELCGDLFRDLNCRAQSVSFDLHPYDWIREMHLIAGERFADNPGLLACMFELPGEFEEFGDVWKSSAHQWNMQVAAFLQEVARLPANPAKQLAFVLGAMAEGIYYQALIRRTSDMTKIGNSPATIADVIAVIWYRTIFFENPPASKIRSSVRILEDTRAPRKPKKRAVPAA
jgi:AcrR family transcriptional regulator